MKEKSEQIPCPTCEKMIFKRGLFGHLRFGHGKTPEEAHEIMSSLDEPLHGSLDEKTEVLEEASLNRDNEEEENDEDEPEEGKNSLLPFILFIGGIAVIFLSRDPRFKEIADKLAVKLKALGSKKSSGSKNFPSWGGGFPPPGF